MKRGPARSRDPDVLVLTQKQSGIRGWSDVQIYREGAAGSVRGKSCRRMREGGWGEVVDVRRRVPYYPCCGTHGNHRTHLNPARFATERIQGIYIFLAFTGLSSMDVFEEQHYS